MLNSALTLPRLLLLLVLGSAGLVWTVHRPDHHRTAHAQLFGNGLISLWGPLRELGCAPPNEHGTFIAAKLRPDENANPYIFECTDGGLVLDGVHLR